MLFQEELTGKGTFSKIDRNGDIGKSSAENRKSFQDMGKERTCSPCHSSAQLPPTREAEEYLLGKASFCTSYKNMRRGSLAVETALVLPLFFLGLVTLISFMDIYKLQTEHLSGLCDKAKTMGMYAYVTGGEGPQEVILPDLYVYEPIGGLLPLPDIRMFNTVKVHAWTGKEYEDQAGEGQEREAEEMVYVTETGSVCHKSLDCTYLKLSVNRVSGSAVSSMRNAYGEKYAPCETCSRNQSPEGSVYITDTGNRYHNLETCSGLKRTVRLMKQSDAAGMAVCSRCG